MTTDLWHPNERGKYWNSQAIQYMIGVNKPYSTKDAERCLKKSVDYGDYAAMDNLCRYMDAGIIEKDPDLYEELKQKLYKNGLLDCRRPSDQLSEKEKEQMIAVQLRTHLEKKMIEIVGKDVYFSPDKKSERLYFALGYAKDHGMINASTFQQYSAIRRWAGSKLHYDSDNNSKYDPNWLKIIDVSEKMESFISSSL